MAAQGKPNGQAQWKEVSDLPIANELWASNVTTLAARTYSGKAGARSAVPLQIEQIYRAPEAGSLALATALRLLPAVVERCRSALAAIEFGDLIQSDDAMIHVHSMLPELFCCRRLGEGFTAIVNAVLSAFEGQKGLPMDKAQIETIYRALAAVRSEPGISFSHSLDYVAAMEGADLNISPSGLDELAGLISG